MSGASIDHMHDVERHLKESSHGVFSRGYSYHRHVEEEEIDRDEPLGPSHEDDDDDTEEEAYVLGPESIRRHGSRGGRGYRGERPGPSHDRRPGGNNAMLDTGGPEILDVLVGFRGHIAHAIWNGEERGVLKHKPHAERLDKWIVMNNLAKQYIRHTGLIQLCDSMFHHINMPLISAFVERWQPETNTFHLPFGEMTVTLHDVYHILKIPVTGEALIQREQLGVVKSDLMELLGMNLDELNGHVKSSGVKLKTLQERLSRSSATAENIAKGYLLHLLGATLFVDKSQTRVSVHYFPFLMDIRHVQSYAWGAATLAFLYRQLGVASRADCRQIGGCLTLLEAWIYEYFPSFRPAKRPDWEPWMSSSKKWINGAIHPSTQFSIEQYRSFLNNFTSDKVKWHPFGRNPSDNVPITLFRGIIHCWNITEPYMPDRFLRQFGYAQYIPEWPPIVPTKVYRGRKPHKYKCDHAVSEHTWVAWRASVVRPETRATLGNNCAANYVYWFTMRSYPKVTSPNASNAANSDDSSDDTGEHPMPPEARLSYVAERLEMTTPQHRQALNDDKLWQLLDEVNHHLEDFYI